MRDTALPVLAVVAALVVAAVAGAGLVLGSDPAGATTDGTADRTITVTAEGSADAAPDRAVVRVAVVAEGEDPGAVRDELAAGATALRENLSAAGVADENVETTDYEIREPHRRGPEDDADGPAYRGVHAFEVTLDDVDAVGSVVDAAADAGAQVQRVRFTLSEEKRADLRDEALRDAMDDADRQAGTLAAASGLEVTTVLEIDATERRYHAVTRDAVATEAGDGGGGTSVETGDVTVSTTIRVTYNATTG